MFARFQGRRISATASTLPTSPSTESAAASKSGTSEQHQQQRRPSSSSQHASSSSSSSNYPLSSSDEATTRAFEEASTMLEELRTVLDRLDHLLIKITPPLIVTPLISLCTPQSQLPVVSQSQEGEHADNDNEHDDDAQIIDSAAIRIDKGQDGMDNDDSDESERRANRNIDDNIIIPQINIHNNNCDTTSKNGSVRNEDETVHIGNDIDPSSALSPSTSNPLPSQFIPPPTTTTSSTIIISRPAKFVAIHPSDINEIIECLRRSAEIVALSERRAGALEEETAVLASTRLEERRRRRRKDKRRTRDIDGNDNDQRNESQSTHISVERQNNELPQGNHSIHDDDDFDNHDYEEKVEEKVDVAARLLPHHIAPFELFCERNVLSKIVGLVTGSTFDNPISPPPTLHSLPPLQPHSGSRQQQHLQSSSLPSPPPLLLPPLSIATQAVQSASILIQNVCRATSLYLLLSNNVVNDLIGLPLESYRQACEAEEADANERDLASAAMTNTGRRWGHQQPQPQQQQQQQLQRRRHRQQRHQQEISELTTHFVSFLKGLAMRVNAETLQFFLSFPVSATATRMTTKDGNEEQRRQEGSGRKERNVEFPLYARALEFCSPLLVLPTSSSSSSSQSSSSRNLAVQRGGDDEGNHQLDDPFVRLTAMSVCMNILRLVTYRHCDDDEHDLESVADQSDDDHDLTHDNEDKDAEYPINENDTNDDEAEDVESGTSKMVGGVVTEGTSTNSEPRKERRHRQHHRHHQHRNTALPTSTPTGLLHENPPVLPLQDRIAIAEFACHPTRVSDLVSPLCVRLTTQFGQVEGMVRMMEELDKDKRGFEDDNANSTFSPTSSTTTTTRGKHDERTKQQKIHIHKQRQAAERSRLCNVLQNLVANVQDELLLLDDLLKVGLISLNEQAIEMLLATFVYPMLLQPLLLPGHQYSSAPGENKDGIVQREKEEDEQDGKEANAAVKDKKLSPNISFHSSAPFSSILCSTTTSTDDHAATTTTRPDLTQTPNHRQLPAWTRSYNCSDLAPSKTALYGLSLVFRTISNPTFRHLLLVALLHPLSPRATGGRPIVRSRPQVTMRKGVGVSDGVSGATKARRKQNEKMSNASSNSNDDSVLEIRTDSNQERHSAECGEPSRVNALYSFGTDDSTENIYDGNDDSASSGGINYQQVFILAPALVDILRHSCAENAGAREEIKPSSDELTVEIGATMTRPNPYRSVILSSMAGSAEMAALQPLATSLLHAAVTSAGSSTTQRIMFPSTATPKHNGAGNSIETESGEETLQCICLSIVNTLVTNNGWWKVKFNPVAARTLVDVISDNRVYISFVYELVGKIRLEAAKFFMEIPSQLDAKSREGEAENTNATLSSAEKRPSALVDKQYLDNWLIDRFFFDRADKSTISVVENVCYLKEYSEEEAKERYRYGLEVLKPSPAIETCALLCDGTTVVDGMVVATTEMGSNTSFHCAASWALTCLYLDAFYGKLTEMVCSIMDNYETGGQQNVPQRKRLSYISPKFCNTEDDISQDEEATSYSLAHLSSKFTIAMLDECESSSSSERNNSESSYDSTSMAIPPEYGSVVGLIGRAAFPCVIEVSSPESSSLFTGRTCISNEGMRWQSLYLVVIGKWAVFAEPGRDGTSAAGGEGRVVASCKLACLSLRRDASLAASDEANAARRILVSHTSLDPRPPPLFVVDSSATSSLSRRVGSGNGGGERRGGGPNLGPNGLRLTRSRMDLWFEDYNAGERARKVISAKIAKARAKRGARLSAALLTR